MVFLTQVLPFYASTLSAEEQDQVSSLEAEQPSEALAKVSPFLSFLKILHKTWFLQAMLEYSSLDNFWKRYNKVSVIPMTEAVNNSFLCLQARLDQLSLEKEKSVLEQENQKLRMLLKQYLDGEHY